MVKKMIVVASVMALIFGAVAIASAFSITSSVLYKRGDMISIPMKVETSFVRQDVPGGYSTLFGGGCEQYTHPMGFWPWGPWSGSKCSMRIKIKPPRCVAPAYAGPVAMAAPPAVWPGCIILKNVESYGVNSPGCNPCVVDGLKYQIVKKQVVK